MNMCCCSYLGLEVDKRLVKRAADYVLSCGTVNFPLVARVADGAYGMGKSAPIERLLALQGKYGAFLYFDDSDSLSAYGERGEGGCIGYVIPRTSPGSFSSILGSPCVLGEGVNI